MGSGTVLPDKAAGTAKCHLVAPSLAVAVLGADKNSLAQDPKTLDYCLNPWCRTTNNSEDR